LRSASCWASSASGLRHLRWHPPADPSVCGPHQRSAGPVHPGRGRSPAAGQAAQDGSLAVPQGPRARADPALHPPPGRAGRPWPGPDRRAHRPGGAAAPRARAGTGGGPGGYQAAPAAAMGLPGRGLGGGCRHPVGDPGHLRGPAAGAGAGSLPPGAAAVSPMWPSPRWRAPPVDPPKTIARGLGRIEWCGAAGSCQSGEVPNPAGVELPLFR
jgi:hypothetical protein